jgi:hypothetical protein
MRRLPPTLIALIALGCGSETRSQTPPPATFSDATVEVAVKDTGADTNKPDTALLADAETDGLLADASDVMTDAVTSPTTVGAEMPAWKLEDFQPKSTGFKKIYGLEAFKGKVTVVALLSGW